MLNENVLCEARTAGSDSQSTLLARSAAGPSPYSSSCFSLASRCAQHAFAWPHAPERLPAPTEAGCGSAEPPSLAAALQVKRLYSATMHIKVPRRLGIKGSPELVVPVAWLLFNARCASAIDVLMCVHSAIAIPISMPLKAASPRRPVGVRLSSQSTF
eukprot:5668780-Pleurochrysis_carterae.AAC.1